MLPFSGQEELRPLNSDDERVLLQLVQKYGLMSLKFAIAGLEESSRTSIVSATSISGTLVSNSSAPSLTWTASDAASVRTGNSTHHRDVDASSIHGSLAEQRAWPPSSDVQSPTPANASSITSHPASPRHTIPTLKKYQCPMCFQDKNLVEFGRKSDFKKHLNNFHGADVVWICRTKGCHLTFATERAYSTHSKETHKMEALPNTSARTELCPQLVFACGFGKCKDRIFEASNATEANTSRDKYFEHIAKHFEDDFDVNEWEYRVQIHNLMRQSRVKSIWKTCIWPKDKRQQLSWKPRSSGDLKRMLECRHLGEDISMMVRLAYVLGTAPFTSSTTPPPSEIDQRFQLPFRSQCLLETESPTTIKSEEIMTPKSRPTSSIFRLPSRKGKTQRPTRPSTPVSAVPDMVPMVRDEQTMGPHPGTPISLPPEAMLPTDGPKFAPETASLLSRQMNIDHSPVHYAETVPMQNDPRHSWVGSTHTMPMSPYDEPMPMAPQQEAYADEMMYGCTPQSAHTIRPATPVPHKRPASWSRHGSMEDMHPKKKVTAYGTPMDSPYASEPLPTAYTHDYVPNAYGEYVPQYHYNQAQQAPTSMPAPEWNLPMRMYQEPQGGFAQPHPHQQLPSQPQYAAPAQEMTFFFDDAEGRM